MAGTKSLAKDSVIYGGTTIITKFFSWLMTPLFTYYISRSDFGTMTNLYACAAVIMVVLTFGMETGFFYFANQNPAEKRGKVYSMSISVVGFFVACFLFSFLIFLPAIRPVLWDDLIPSVYLRLVIIISAMDTFIAVPFAFLRYEKRPVRFGFFKILQVILYALLCVFFLVVCPKINESHPEWIAWFWQDNFKVGYILIANLIATGVQTLCLILTMTKFRFSFDWKLAKQMIAYCFPLMLMGLAGMSNQVVDKIVFPTVYPDKALAMSELGVYSACFKIGVIMVIFTQAFRYAFDPFMFEKGKDGDAKSSYALIMKYFVCLGLLVFLVVMFYLDIFKRFVAPEYWVALKIIPIVLMGELFFAVYYNLSLWYKLTKQTYWGTIFSTIGFVIIVSLNLLFIPKYSYMACAWAAFAGNAFIMILSYFVGQKRYPIHYNLKNIGFYAGLAAILFAVSYFIPIQNQWLQMGFNSLLLGIYLYCLIRKDLPLKRIPYIQKWIR
ncbi:MAG: lipopolysaccharide biosynthesis protein [Dysgonamonadaceae bacterium]|jgi:O-antigen/teichoic acid export membrane protein|nr:lipopolysaccharide biosynthesis protein [Dysgonamonadaceae bacterium]